MPARFESGIYTPDVVVLMKAALDGALAKTKLKPPETEEGRHLLASAIIDSVDRGVRDRQQLVAEAVAMFATARNISECR